ncbi:Copia protein, partial [Mucuna pruriens]
MIVFPSYFTSYIKVSKEQLINVANGDHVPIIGSSYIQLQSSLSLINVLHVPKLANNLYPSNKKGFKCYHSPSRQIFISMDVTFHETQLFFVSPPLQEESYLEVESVIESLPFPAQDVIESLPIPIQDVIESLPFPIQDGQVNIPENLIEDVTDDMPIALSKGKQSCVKYPNSQFDQLRIKDPLLDIQLGGKKENVVARSNAEAEFRAMIHNIYEGLWMKIILDDLKVKYEGPIKLFYDNNSTISISYNPVQHDRTKHIEIDKHFIKEKLNSGLVVTAHVPTTLQVAYIFIKGLPTTRFQEHNVKLRMIDIHLPTLGGVLEISH